MNNPNVQILSVVTWMAAAAALLVVIVLPLSVFYYGYLHYAGKLEAQAELQSALLSQIISENPAMWRYRSQDYNSFFSRNVADDVPSRMRIVDKDGDVIAAFSLFGEASLKPPMIVRGQPLFDAGHEVGRVEVARSIRPLVERTALVALIATVAATLLFITFRVFPYRALQKAWGKVAFLASHDALTGLPNRVLFADRLGQVLASSRRTGESGAVLSIDLDRFKDVNDTQGHAAGDMLLRSVAARLKACVRETDTLARLGGDEFAIVQSDAPQPQGAAHLAQRVIDALSEPFAQDGQDLRVGASVGIALFDGDNEAGQLLRDADIALYRAKIEGRSTYRFFEEDMNARLQARKAMERDLRNALNDGGLDVHYQPQIELETGQIVGVEALARWTHPERGIVPPCDFIPLAEDAGLIGQLGEIVLRKACAQATAWVPLKLAVNLSPIQFRQPDLAAMVARVLAETGLEPRRLELEITEGVLLKDTEATLATLHALKDLGVSVAMDDFGTGYSSLSYLRRFPFDKIKIDQSFVRDLGRWDQADAIVRAVIGLGRSLGMRTNAEGVERKEQAILLQREGCTECQGYLFSRPVPAVDLQKLLSPHVDLPAETSKVA